ncbi:MAG: hypothetical protein IPK28_18835 [Devosia sp.]|nr:hypothetical protein [Devosia sp.]
MDAQSLYTSPEEFVLGRGKVDTFGESGVIAPFLVAPLFLTEDLASSEDIWEESLAEAHEYDDYFLRECINSAFDGYGSGLDTVGNFSPAAPLSKKGGQDVPGFSRRSTCPVGSTGLRDCGSEIGYRVFAAVPRNGAWGPTAATTEASAMPASGCRATQACTSLSCASTLAASTPW